MGRLSLTGIGKSYGDVEISRDIDLTIEDGEFVVFVGPSGCGKSTLLRMIAGLEEITQGDMQLDGTRINEIPPQERDIGMVFQSYALYPHMNVADNMAFGLKLARTEKGEIRRRVQHAAEMLHLTELLERKPKDLSGGSVSGWRLAARWSRSPPCSCLMSHFPTSTPHCGWICACRSPSCTSVCKRR